MSKPTYYLECYAGGPTPLWRLSTQDFHKCTQFVQMLVQGFRRKTCLTTVSIVKYTPDHPHRGAKHFSELYTLNGMDADTTKRLGLMAGFTKAGLTAHGYSRR